MREVERFLEKFSPEPMSGCWIWIGCGERHGLFRFRGRLEGAHVASWILFIGEVPVGMEVCHKCDIGICVNPAHLFLDTHAGNMADMARKGRSLHGERNPHSRLTTRQIKEIRNRYIRGNGAALAREFGTDKSRINNIIKRKSWRNV